jgi:hypothetical protein
MSRVGQISVATPGEPLQLFFDATELPNVLGSVAKPGDHVTLYPGNYTQLSPNTEVEVPEGVGVTILPGCKIDYVDGFREQNFAHDTEPPAGRDADVIDSLEGNQRDHPLSDGAVFPTAERYNIPNFTGFVENISDQNFGSEWAFESDVEDLRDTVNSLNTDRFFTFQSPLANDAVDATLGETIELRNGPDMIIDFDRLSSGDGIYIDWEIDTDFGVTRVNAGNKLEMVNAQIVDDVEVRHIDISTGGSPQNSGLDVIQSITTDDGHVTNVETRPVAEVVNSVPQDTEGENGDIRLLII